MKERKVARVASEVAAVAVELAHLEEQVVLGEQLTSDRSNARRLF